MAESDLDRVIAEQNIIEDNWTSYKKEAINAALSACERLGFPTSDEPLCCLLEDVLDHARQHLTSDD